jgi:hypothetical protein
MSFNSSRVDAVLILICLQELGEKRNCSPHAWIALSPGRFAEAAQRLGVLIHSLYGWKRQQGKDDAIRRVEQGSNEVRRA